jgi:hypothetical protein
MTESPLAAREKTFDRDAYAGDAKNIPCGVRETGKWYPKFCSIIRSKHLRIDVDSLYATLAHHPHRGRGMPR